MSTLKRTLMDLLSSSAFSFTSAAKDVTVCFSLKSSVLIACTSFNSQMLVFGVIVMSFAVMLHILTGTLDVFLGLSSITIVQTLTLLVQTLTLDVLFSTVTAPSTLCVFLTNPVMVLTSHSRILTCLVDLTIPTASSIMLACMRLIEMSHPLSSGALSLHNRIRVLHMIHGTRVLSSVVGTTNGSMQCSIC